MSSGSRPSMLSASVQDADEEDMCAIDDEGGTHVHGIYIPPPITHKAMEQSKTRLIITKISNHFFKSYAEEQILGPFSKCFNAIVGPNGSGKSNVIDSMLFVFGYRATKIRSKKISVLLHNSEKYQNVQTCRVSVHFCEIIDTPGEEYEMVPGSEFVVSRVAGKDNSSYYLLNDRKVQFKEVARLLRKHGIDLDHNRFLILQGEVEEIATMKCIGANENETGMLEYLEDVIGTNQYKKPLFELNEKIDQLSELRTSKLNRVTLIRKQLDELKEPMEEAVNFLKFENTVTLSKNIIYQNNVIDLEGKVEGIKEDHENVNNECNNIVTKLKELAQQKSEKDAELKAESKKYDGLKKQKDKLKEAFDQADKKDVQLQANMTQLNNNRKKYKQQLSEEMKKLEELQKIPEKNEADIAECDIKEKQCVAKKEKLETEKKELLLSLRHETEDLQKQKEKLEIQLSDLEKTVNETKSAHDLAECKLNLCRNNEERENSKLEKLQEMINNNDISLKEKTEQCETLKKKIPSTEKCLNDVKSNLKAVRSQEMQINNEVKKKRRSLEETRSTMQMARSRGKVLDALMQKKREGECPGIYGRLGDLGAIDLKYDVAISTACGPLDNIVVDTVDTAEWCIAFLKQHGIGRATFIPLEKQEHLREYANSKIQTPENVHRLFDLVHVKDDTVKTAFYFALRDTLVSDDLDQATRIAYGAQRFRVVTLKGELVETSGTMSGGGRSVIRGRMGQSVVANSSNPQEIEKMESDLRKAEEQLRTLLQEQSKLEEQENTLDKELSTMKMTYEKYSRDLKALTDQQPQLLKQLKSQQAVAQSTKADPKQVQNLTHILNEKKTAYDKASKAAEKIRVEVDKLTHEIQEKSSGKMKTVEKNLAEMKKTIEKCRAECTRLRVAITTSERNTKKCEQKISTLQQNIEDAENNMRQMKAQRDEILENGKELLKSIEEIAGQIGEGEDGFSGLKEEIKEFTKEENNLKLKKVDLDNLLKNIKEKLSNSTTAIHTLKAKIKNLKLHQIPHEDIDELKTFTAEELGAMNLEQVQHTMQTAQNSLQNASPNLNIIVEYNKTHEIFMQKSLELDEVTKQRNEVKNWHDKVKTQRKNEFIVGYNTIRLKLKEVYQMITLGGDADFEIVDSFDPFTEGILFNVRPPKKSWKSISNLSGGEKTLSSLALVFALHYYKPSPLYVMDEIDAALDFKNVSIIGQYIKERTKNAQFIIISLRSNMTELADHLVGIYKIENCTRTICINPHTFNDTIKEGGTPQEQCA